MTIRRLLPSDAVAYRQLMLEAYELHPDAFTSSRSERAALRDSWWESRLAIGETAGEVVLGAFEHDRLAGVAGVAFETREKARHKATLFGMYVPAAYRQRGLGSALVLAALELAKSRAGVIVMQLTVTEGNRGAQALYEQCGFVAFGLEPLAVATGTTFVSKVHMWRRLDTEIPLPSTRGLAP